MNATALQTAIAATRAERLPRVNGSSVAAAPTAPVSTAAGVATTAAVPTAGVGAAVVATAVVTVAADDERHAGVRRRTTAMLRPAGTSSGLHGDRDDDDRDDGEDRDHDDG